MHEIIMKYYNEGLYACENDNAQISFLNKKEFQSFMQLVYDRRTRNDALFALRRW